jgi:high-affinity Fe2+/Pb2+ permease
MGPAAILNILVTANTSQATAALARTNAMLTKTTANATASSNKMGTAVAKGAKGGALAVAALGAGAVVAAAKFESSFADVRKTVDATERQPR